MMLDHTHTRTRRADNRRIALCKGMHKVQCNRTRLIFEAIVEEWLSTAGLLRREGQFHSQVLQDMGHILKRGCIELIAETGKEELGFWHENTAFLKFAIRIAHSTIFNEWFIDLLGSKFDLTGFLQGR